jgi:hypothetical protein
MKKLTGSGAFGSLRPLMSKIGHRAPADSVISER